MQESRYKLSMPSCQICCKCYDMYYHVPRVLPKCGHTFCQKCIKSKLQQKKTRPTFTCPQCQSDTIIRKSVADELPKNITIADLVKDVKYKNMDREDEPDAQSLCREHTKKLEMICLSCAGIRICSHCAVFGEHKGHNIGNQLTATKQDIKQLHQFMLIIEDTVTQVLMPESPGNIEKQCRSKLTESLQQCVKESFKPYYQELSRRETELLTQCESVVIDESGVDRIDSILTSFDILKIRAEESSVNVGRSQVQEIIESAKNLHSEIEKVVSNYNHCIQTFLQQARAKIKEVCFFEVQPVEKRSLKAILRGSNSPQAKAKARQLAKLMETKKQEEKSRRPVTEKEKCPPPLDRKKTETLLTDKVENKPKLINATNTPASKVKTQRVIPKQIAEQVNAQSNYSSQNNGSNECNKNIQLIQNQPEGVSRVVKNKGSSVRKSEVGRTPEKHGQGQRDKSPINMITEAAVDLKYVKPTKELSYEFRSKFQGIIAEIERQHPEGTLELIGLDICDTLIPYICEYLLGKKLKFSMIKLVKNLITDEGLRVLLSYLSMDAYTKVLNLTGNQITQKCFPTILQFIGVNNICKMIYLSNNKITPMQLKKIQPALDQKFMQVLL